MTTRKEYELPTIEIFEIEKMSTITTSDREAGDLNEGIDLE